MPPLLNWTQSFPTPPTREMVDTKGKTKIMPAIIDVSINVPSFSDETTRQLTMFVTDLIRKGVTLSGQDDPNGRRLMRMEASS